MDTTTKAYLNSQIAHNQRLLAAMDEDYSHNDLKQYNELLDEITWMKDEISAGHQFAEESFL